MIMEESQCNELPSLINCFDLIKSLYENSLSENDNSQGGEILQTPICNRIDDLNICLSDEKEIKDFVNNNTNLILASKSLELRFISEELCHKDEIETNYNHKKDNTQTSNDLCMHITCDGDPELDNCSLKKNSRESMPVQCHILPISLGSCKTNNIDLDIEMESEPIVNLSSINKEAFEVKNSMLELDYSSRHQSLSIIKLLKKNSTKKIPASKVSEGNSSDVDSISEKQSSDKHINCRRTIKRNEKKKD